MRVGNESSQTGERGVSIDDRHRTSVLGQTDRQLQRRVRARARVGRRATHSNREISLGLKMFEEDLHQTCEVRRVTPCFEVAFEQTVRHAGAGVKHLIVTDAEFGQMLGGDPGRTRSTTLEGARHASPPR